MALRAAYYKVSGYELLAEPTLGGKKPCSDPFQRVFTAQSPGICRVIPFTSHIEVIDAGPCVVTGRLDGGTVEGSVSFEVK